MHSQYSACISNIEKESVFALQVKDFHVQAFVSFNLRPSFWDIQVAENWNSFPENGYYLLLFIAA